MAVNDEPGRSIVGQASEPAQEKVMQRGLADPDWRIRPDPAEAHVRWHVLGRGDPNVLQSVRSRVGPNQVEGPLIDVDRPDLGRRGAHGESQRHRAVATPEIEEWSA